MATARATIRSPGPAERSRDARAADILVISLLAGSAYAMSPSVLRTAGAPASERERGRGSWPTHEEEDAEGREARDGEDESPRAAFDGLAHLAERCFTACLAAFRVLCGGESGPSAERREVRSGVGRPGIAGRADGRGPEGGLSGALRCGGSSVRGRVRVSALAL